MVKELSLLDRKDLDRWATGLCEAGRGDSPREGLAIPGLEGGSVCDLRPHR